MRRNTTLEGLGIGDAVWAETTLAAYAKDQRLWNPAQSRRPRSLIGRTFSTRLYTCVGSNAGDLRYALRIVRTA